MEGTNGQEPKVDEVYNERDADVVLISSDNVSFKIHGYFLQAVSPVFRALLQKTSAVSSPAIQTIPFTDDKLERAAVLKLLLHMATSTPLGTFDDIPCDDVIDLIYLCDKYDCATPQQLLNLWIDPQSKPIQKYHRFFYACALGNTDAAFRLFTAAATLNFAVHMTPDDFSIAVSGCGGLDVTGMPALWLDKLPRKYFLALLRASRLRMQVPDATWQSVADEFKKQVLLQESTSALSSI